MSILFQKRGDTSYKKSVKLSIEFNDTESEEEKRVKRANALENYKRMRDIQVVKIIRDIQVAI
jgi:hypothetical protein